MFFSVASPDWKPGQPMAPTGALLFRSRSEAQDFAPEAQVVAVAVRHNAAAGVVVARECAALAGGSWSSRAVGNALGGVTVFGAIPAPLVRVPSDFGRRLAPADEPINPAEGFGWDSLTMALLA